MSTLAKVLVVVNLILAATLLAGIGNYLGQQDTWRDRHRVEKEGRELDTTNSNARVSDLQGRVASQDASIRTLNAENARLKTESSRVLAESTSIKASYDALAEAHNVAVRSNERMTNTLTANRDLITTLEASLATQREQISALQETRSQGNQLLSSKEIALERMQASFKQQEQELASAQERIRQQEFALNVFRERFPGVEVATQPPHTGRVLTANAAANVYTISLGTEDGVRPGFTYTVSRGAKFIGTIQIDDVQNKQSAGRAIRDLSAGEIQAGDVISNAK